MSLPWAESAATHDLCAALRLLDLALVNNIVVEADLRAEAGRELAPPVRAPDARVRLPRVDLVRLEAAVRVDAVEERQRRREPAAVGRQRRVNAPRDAREAHRRAHVEEERARLRARPPARVVDHQVRDVEEAGVVRVRGGVRAADAGERVPRDAVERLDRLRAIGDVEVRQRAPLVGRRLGRRRAAGPPRAPRVARPGPRRGLDVGQFGRRADLAAPLAVEPDELAGRRAVARGAPVRRHGGPRARAPRCGDTHRRRFSGASAADAGPPSRGRGRARRRAAPGATTPRPPPEPRARPRTRGDGRAAPLLRPCRLVRFVLFREATELAQIHPLVSSANTPVVHGQSLLVSIIASSRTIMKEAARARRR